MMAQKDEAKKRSWLLLNFVFLLFASSGASAMPRPIAMIGSTTKTVATKGGPRRRDDWASHVHGVKFVGSETGKAGGAVVSRLKAL